MTSAPRRTGRVRAILIALAVVGTGAAMLALLNPLPPRRVLMATGPKGGAYAGVAKRYQAILARHGVRLDLVETDGAVDNVERLRDARSGVSIALIQGGVTSAEESPELASLGTVFYEPVWLFVRGEGFDRAAGIAAGRRVCIGLPRSGTRKLSEEIGAAIGAGFERAEVRNFDPEQAADALQKGVLDLAAFVLAWEAPVVQRLLADPGLRTLPWDRADAHLALRPYLSKVKVPRGVADLARDLPPQDLHLVAPKASLAVRSDLNPAIQYLLLEAASEVHGRPGIFNRAGAFPAAEPDDLPLAENARQYYRSGPPFLMRYLPFWLAVFTAQMLFLLVPLIGVAYPLFRLLPAGYFWWMRRRIFRLYSELKLLEAEMILRDPAHPIAGASDRLDALEQRANALRVPASLTYMLYTLRDHIGMVRSRLG